MISQSEKIFQIMQELTDVSILPISTQHSY